IGYSQKEKNEAKSDKTEHGIGKSVKNSRVFPTSPLQHTDKTSPSHTTPLHINPIPCWQSLEFLLGDDLKTKIKGCDELAWRTRLFDGYGYAFEALTQEIQLTHPKLHEQLIK
ncbi:hypothetical protein Tco_0984264, partial [Tanacetum coccineum]